MTTHLRARAAQAGALLAVFIGGIAVAPAVALASPPNVQITNLQTNVVAGANLAMQYQVADTNDGGQGGQLAIANIRITGMTCSGDCDQRTQVDRAGRLFSAQLTAPTVDAGTSRDVAVQVTVTINGESNSDTQTVTVQGPDKPQSVRQVTGKVKDDDGKPIAGAAVGLQDSNGAHQATSDGSGAFAFTSTDNNPIAAGTIEVGAGKDGYKSTSVTVQAQAGRTVNVSLTLKLLAATSTPSPTVSTAAASDEPTTEDTVPATADTAAGVNAANTANQSSGGISWLYIIVGILLVAAGAGAILLVFLRRRHNDDGDDDDPTSLGGPGPMVPPAYGRFNDATRVATPIGMGGAGMVAPGSGAGSMSDAPTMLHRPVPVDDEFPDPYGVPITQQGGYAGAGGWSNQGYPESNQYGTPPADQGYDYGGGANYGGSPQQPYDEPTGLYQPEVDDAGYGDYDRGGYGGGADQRYGAAPVAPGGATYGAASAAGSGRQYEGGYADPEPAGRGGYSTWGSPAGGIDGGAAYGPRPGSGSAASGGGASGGGQRSSGSGYEQGGYGEQPGYSEQGGYDQDGYDQDGRGAYRARYEQSGPDEQPGYQHRASTYGEQRSRRGGLQEPSHPGQRRSSEWDG